MDRATSFCIRIERRAGLDWFVEQGSSPVVAAICALLVVPFVYELALRGHVWTRLSSVLPEAQASIATAVISAPLWLVPSQLAFGLGIALVLCELRRRSGSLIPGLVASTLASGLALWAG